jgi:hypothetical protein
MTKYIVGLRSGALNQLKLSEASMQDWQPSSRIQLPSRSSEEILRGFRCCLPTDREVAPTAGWCGPGRLRSDSCGDWRDLLRILKPNFTLPASHIIGPLAVGWIRIRTISLPFISFLLSLFRLRRRFTGLRVIARCGLDPKAVTSLWRLLIRA